MVDFDTNGFVVEGKLDGFDHLKPPIFEGIFVGDVGACVNLCEIFVHQGIKRKQSDCEIDTKGIFYPMFPIITRLNSSMSNILSGNGVKTSTRD